MFRAPHSPREQRCGQNLLTSNRVLAQVPARRGPPGVVFQSRARQQKQPPLHPKAPLHRSRFLSLESWVALMLSALAVLACFFQPRRLELPPPSRVLAEPSRLQVNAFETEVRSTVTAIFLFVCSTGLCSVSLHRRPCCETSTPRTAHPLITVPHPSRLASCAVLIKETRSRLLRWATFAKIIPSELDQFGPTRCTSRKERDRETQGGSENPEKQTPNKKKLTGGTVSLQKLKAGIHLEDRSAHTQVSCFPSFTSMHPPMAFALDWFK